MTFAEYGAAVEKFARYPGVDHNLVYPALKLCGEAGEIAEKVGKLWRDTGRKAGENLTADEREGLLKELGDVLWYINALASLELDSSLDEVAALNIEKLTSRHERGTLAGSGDDR